MLSELCHELKNWFERDKYIGDFKIINGAIVNGDGSAVDIKENQYFRIIGSVFNDGVHKYPTSDLIDESFDGAVWALAIPKEVIDLSNEIDEWQQKYGGIDSEAMSPFTSESFGGYSYSKSDGRSSNGTSSASTWKGAFASRLNNWRKI